MNKEKKYAMAIIKIPIEIFDEDQSHEIMNDRITIDIEPCLNLPEPNNLDNVDLLSQLFSGHKDVSSTSTEPETIQQLQSETIQQLQSETIQQLQSETIQPLQSETIQPLQSETIQPLEPETIQPIETIPKDNTMIILSHEKIPKHPKNRENITFKRNHSKPKHSYTQRVYPLLNQ